MPNRASRKHGLINVALVTHCWQRSRYAGVMQQIIEMPASAELHRQLPEVFRSIVNSASVKMVYGGPVSVGNKTVLPVASIRYGFGGGSGTREDSHQHGGGGGGGLIAKPLGLV